LSATLIDGRALAAEIRAELAREAELFVARTRRRPTLAVVWVGADPASERYTRQIRREFDRSGFDVRGHSLADDTSEADMIDLLAALDVDTSIDGVLVQTPLPEQIDFERVARAIPARKDVDGVHPENAGLLFANAGHYLAPATPSGGIALLERHGVQLRGRHAVVVGRSPNVGKPMAMMLLHRDATVTICHSRTERLADVVRQGEILVAAAGVAGLVRGAWIRPGAVVIDFGVSVIDGVVVGDVHFDSAVQVAGAITPVPGGTGPMTVAMLMQNTLRAARRSRLD
jgi:methylenetetrahydrofolate dehydrogenase (NADP+)/methenyltetrahydrofolate cyclohydrolase